MMETYTPVIPIIWENVEAAMVVLNHMGELDIHDTNDPDDGRWEAILRFGNDDIMISRQLDLETTLENLYYRVADALWAAVNGKVVII
jgi:hypothetical protein